MLPPLQCLYPRLRPLLPSLQPKCLSAPDPPEPRVKAGGAGMDQPSAPPKANHSEDGRAALTSCLAPAPAVRPSPWTDWLPGFLLPGPGPSAAAGEDRVPRGGWTCARAFISGESMEPSPGGWHSPCSCTRQRLQAPSPGNRDAVQAARAGGAEPREGVLPKLRGSCTPTGAALTTTPRRQLHRKATERLESRSPAPFSQAGSPGGMDRAQRTGELSAPACCPRPAWGSSAHRGSMCQGPSQALLVHPAWPAAGLCPAQLGSREAGPVPWPCTARPAAALQRSRAPHPAARPHPRSKQARAWRAGAASGCVWLGGPAAPGPVCYESPCPNKGLLV